MGLRYFSDICQHPVIQTELLVQCAPAERRNLHGAHRSMRVAAENARGIDLCVAFPIRQRGLPIGTSID